MGFMVLHKPSQRHRATATKDLVPRYGLLLLFSFFIYKCFYLIFFYFTFWLFLSFNIIFLLFAIYMFSIPYFSYPFSVLLHPSLCSLFAPLCPCFFLCFCLVVCSSSYVCPSFCLVPCLSWSLPLIQCIDPSA